VTSLSVRYTCALADADEIQPGLVAAAAEQTTSLAKKGPEMQPPRGKDRLEKLADARPAFFASTYLENVADAQVVTGGGRVCGRNRAVQGRRGTATVAKMGVRSVQGGALTQVVHITECDLL
jgi:hypothetical protein